MLDIYSCLFPLKVSHSREALKQCKILLQSKRDDVRRLWLDWCEQKFYYENISKLKHLFSSGENIRALCAQKKYLEAAELIAECSTLLDTQYHEIPALNEVKRNIETERIKLQNHLLAEATEQIFHSVTRDVLETGIKSIKVDLLTTGRRMVYIFQTLPFRFILTMYQLADKISEQESAE